MNLEAVMKRCRREEGAVPWMYLDSAKPPNVTVGEGHLIADAAEAQKLGFMAGDSLATPQEVAAEFTRVAALPGGHSADAPVNWPEGNRWRRLRQIPGRRGKSNRWQMR